ncbi:uncharacterized protein LOC127632539 [Xyrauchen texanus]|uniref:uncharacterized protein LOC127632539 n=1 Tax=Xyrauchen texanus TaxID=154827 RepID=UPI002241F4D2|nr:uncharacterized protein LOC127632539 [Xyrauchen texanus]
MYHSYVAEYDILSVVVYSALFKSALEKRLNYAEFDRIFITVLFGIMLLYCFIRITYVLVAKIGQTKGRIIDIFDIVAYLIFDFLPTLQFILLFYTIGAAKGGLFIVAVLPVMITMTNDTLFYKCYRLGFSESVIRTQWIIVILVMNGVMIVFFIMTTEKEKDPIGWACVIVFLQILWIIMKFTDPYYIFIAHDFYRFVPVYLFGSVGVVLISAVTLMTELILKTFNGDRAVLDLRFIIFPSEGLFVLSVLISGQFASRIKKCLQSCQTQNVAGSDETAVTGSNPNTVEMNPLLQTQDQEAGRSEETEETQPDSVV